jgi:hypothetical protein
MDEVVFIMRLDIYLDTCLDTPSVSFYLSLDSAKLHYPATNKKKRREYIKSNILENIRHLIIQNRESIRIESLEAIDETMTSSDI